MVKYLQSGRSILFLILNLILCPRYSHLLYPDGKFEAGLVEPELVPIGIGEFRGKEAGITVEDIFRDEQTGIKLYWEIIQHSLLRFRGIKELFFWLLIKRLRLGDLANFTRRLRLKLHSPTEAIQ